jgi:uncharacterized membrane protein
VYTTILFIHILAGLAWFGGGLFFQLHMNRLRAADGQSAAASQLETFFWSEKWIFIPAPLLALLTGITMVATNDVWGFSQPWGYLSLGLWVASAIMGAQSGARMSNRSWRPGRMEATWLPWSIAICRWPGSMSPSRRCFSFSWCSSPEPECRSQSSSPTTTSS